MVGLSCETFPRWKQGGNSVSYIRCDNAGENKTLQRRANGVDWKLNLAFEFTPRETPQHNRVAELGLASISSKRRAIMSAANIPTKVQNRLRNVQNHDEIIRKTSKALCHVVENLVFVTFFKDMHVPFGGIAYVIVFNKEGIASLHFPVDIDVLFSNQCYSGLSCCIFNTPAGVNQFCKNVCQAPAPALGS
jgi:hypothetical protein